MDGCTGIPEIIFGIDITHCCTIHDATLMATRDWVVFDAANLVFAHCLADAGLWWLAPVALLAVATIGRTLFRFGPKNIGKAT